MTAKTSCCCGLSAQSLLHSLKSRSDCSNKYWFDLAKPFLGLEACCFTGGKDSKFQRCGVPVTGHVLVFWLGRSQAQSAAMPLPLTLSLILATQFCDDFPLTFAVEALCQTLFCIASASARPTAEPAQVFFLQCHLHCDNFTNHFCVGFGVTFANSILILAGHSQITFLSEILS